MKIAVVGTGYVGLVSGACFADMGNDVICVDVDAKKIESIKKGELPIYEPGLAEIVQRNTEAKRLSFTTKLEEALKTAQICFIAVGNTRLKPILHNRFLLLLFSSLYSFLIYCFYDNMRAKFFLSLCVCQNLSDFQISFPCCFSTKCL